jgi:hypothetical protein
VRQHFAAFLMTCARLLPAVAEVHLVATAADKFDTGRASQQRLPVDLPAVVFAPLGGEIEGPFPIPDAAETRANDAASTAARLLHKRQELVVVL